MAQFDTFYTGKGLYKPIPGSERMDKSLERMSDFITKAAEIKLNIYRENEKEFLKNANISPEFVLSKSAREATALQIEEFNKKWSRINAQKASSGGLTTEEKMQMASDKNVIIEQNKNDVADMQNWAQQRDVVLRDPFKWDAVEFSERTNDMIKGNGYKYTTPPIKAQSLDLALQENPVAGTAYNKEIPQPQNNVQGIASTTYSGTEQEAREHVKNIALKNPAYLKDLITQFSALDEKTKLEYLDISPKDNVISPSEARATNPIIRWAQDTKWQKAIKETPHSWKRTATTSASTSFNWNIGISEKHNQNDKFDIQKGIKFGVIQVDSFLNLAPIAPSPRTQQIQNFVDLETGEEVIFNNAANFNVVGYSPDKDMLIVRIASDISSNGINLFKDKTIGLKGSQYDDFLRKKPFGIDRTSLMGNKPPTSSLKEELLKLKGK